MINVSRKEDRQKVELVINGESVSWLWIIDLNMRIGSAVLRIGGIGGVKTKPEHRLKGYAAKVLNKSMQVMQEDGYDLSILFGIPNFYHRFGYISVLPEYTLQILTRSAEKAGSVYSLRPFEMKDMEPVLDIYHQENSSRTGSIIRSKESWKGFPKGSGYDIKAKAVVVESEGKVIGYAAYDDSQEKVNITEVAGLNKDVYSTLLNKFAALAVERRVENIKVYLPPDHPFAYFCRSYGYKFETFFPYNRGGMGRIINFESTFFKLKKEFTKRIANLNINKPKLINVVTDIGSVTFEITANKISIIPQQNLANYDCTLKINQNNLMPLLMGYESVHDVIYRTKEKYSEDNLALLDILFPVGYPYMWLSDRF